MTHSPSSVEVPGTMFALAPAYAMVIAELMEADGDVSDEELAARFHAIGDAFDTKVEKLQMVYRHLCGDAAAAKAFADQMAKPYAERAARHLAAAERVKKIVLDGLTTAGVERVETPLGGARLQRNNPSVVFAGDPASLPEPFRRTTYELDGTAALAAHKAKLPLPDGVTVVTDKKHVRWL